MSNSSQQNHPLDYLIDDDRRAGVRETHRPDHTASYPTCASCTEDWPCVTIELLWSLDTFEAGAEPEGKHDCLKYEVVVMDGNSVYSYCKRCGEVINA